MTNHLDELFEKVLAIYKEYHPKEKRCIGEIAMEFIEFQRKFTVVTKEVTK